MISEAVEGQGLVKENADRQNTHRTQCRARVHSELEGVRRIARRDKEVKFTWAKLRKLQETMGTLLPQIRYWIKTGWVAANKVVSLQIPEIYCAPG